MKAYVYVFDTLADWEIGYVTAELNSGRSFKHKGTTMPVVPIATEVRKVKTMGGLVIEPQLRMEEVSFEAGDLLILPGGDIWLEPANESAVLEVAAQCLEENVTVAAICGATLGLAGKGLLDNRKHTSNDLEFLKAFCPRYAGSQNYLNQPAVTDRNLVTASGVAPLEFAYQIMKTTGVCKTEVLEAWYKLYKYQDSQYYYQWMELLK